MTGPGCTGSTGRSEGGHADGLNWLTRRREDAKEGAGEVYCVGWDSFAPEEVCVAIQRRP
jgi:hypothetical protein